VNSIQQLLADERIAPRATQPALICGAESVSFGELADRVRRSAAALRTFGVRPGERVLLLMRDTPAFAAAWLGTIYAGSVAIALNSRLSEADYRHILADSGARLAIVEDVFTQARPDLTAELAASGRIAVAGAAGRGLPSWDEKVAAAAAVEAHPVELEAPALWLYSSGTTGRPKGIVHSHRAITCVGGSFRALGVAAGDRVYTTSRLFFAYGIEHGLLAPLALGATALLSADWPDADAVIDTVDRHRPTAVFSVPTIYRRLLAEPPARLAAFSACRFVAGGERLSARLVEQWREATGGELLNLYGMSETFCACVLTPPGTSDGLRTGAPLAGVEVRLLDSSDAEPSKGEPGVLWVRHPAQAQAYANLPEKTREQLRDGWFCSRDMFVRDAAGYLVHQGRSDELLKIAGQWVHPGELEEVAARDGAVAEAACVPVIDADGLERLALFVTARGDREAALRAAAAACESALPRHKRPKWLRAVAELPRTATGKVQRYKLRELLEQEFGGKASGKD
jgi:acyl-coenzyme A synthetase/AMP-(fatty) acid ligase